MKPAYFYSLVLIAAVMAHAVNGAKIKQDPIASFRQDEFIIDTSVTTIPGYGNQITPVVASDGTNFLLVWTEFRNMKLQIFGARMDQNGVLLDTLAIPIATKAETQYAPAVVFGGSYYFVVWEEYHEVFEPSWGYWYPRRICGTRISISGTVMDTSGIFISNDVGFESYDHAKPDVAFDGTNFLVVWVGPYSRVQGARVDQSGNVLDPPFNISPISGYGVHPCVAFTGSYYLVAWDNPVSHAPYQADTGQISCARVATGGALIDTNAIIVSAGGHAKIDPEIAGDSVNFFIVWEDYRYMWDTLYGIEIYGARVTQTGVVMDTGGIHITRNRPAQRTPAVSYDGTNYFVAWKDNRNWMWSNIYDIYGARVSRSGTIIDSFGIAITKDTTTQTADIECYPEVAFGSECYLAVWQHGRRSKPAQYDVFTARVARTGTVIDTSGVDLPAQVPGHQYSSASAFDGTNYLVAWNDYHYGIDDTLSWYLNADYSDIYGLRLSGTGVVLDNAAIKITSGATDQVNPSIGFDGTNYFVVWEDDSAYQYWYEPGMIKGTRITPSGMILDTSRILIAAPENTIYQHPVVGFDGVNYLVVFYDDFGQKVVCRRVATTGVVIDPSNIVIASGQPNLPAGGRPGVAFNGTNYMVIWAGDEDLSSSNIYGACISPVDTVLIVISYANGMQWRPAIAFDGTNYLVVWEDWRNASGQSYYGDIYGARVSPTGSVLDPQGIPICTAYNDQECPDVGFDGTNYVVVWQDLRDTTSYSIYGAKVSPSGNVLNTYQVVTDPYDQMEPAITRGNGDQMLITYTGWTSMINSHRAHTMRIWGRMYPFPGVEEGSGMPSSGRMLSLNAYPNPCRDRIEIKWVVPKASGNSQPLNDRRLLVYDVTGREVKDMSRLLASNSNLNQTTWDMTDDAGRRLSAGVYFMRLEIPGKEVVEKVVLIK